MIPAAEALADWPGIELDHDLVEKVRHGHRIPAGENAKELVDPANHPYAEAEQLGLVRAITEQGDLVAVMRFIEEAQEWQPKKVFFQS